MKICTKCNQEQKFDDFPKGQNRCKICTKIYMDRWRNNNRKKINKNQKLYHSTLKGRASVLLNAAKKRAKQRNEQFCLSLNDVVQGLRLKKCSKTGLKFDFSTDNRGKKYQINPLSPSIDKINPDDIYKPENVQYVCSWFNFAKGQMTEDDLKFFCKRYLKYND